MLNHIIVMGRLTRDPDMRKTQGGTNVANFSLACDRDFKDKDSGERQTDFLDCVAWGAKADFAEKYLSKGRMVVVEGRLQIRDWTDKDNNKRRSAEIQVDSIYFADSKPSEGSNSAPAPDTVAPSPEFTELSGDDGKLPF